MKSSLSRLRAFATAEAGRVTAEGMGLDHIGLLLRPDDASYCYQVTPRNVTVFGGSGGDGVHYCLLNAGTTADDGPIVMVVPANPDEPRLVVGEDLHDFLCLGSVTGFFFLEQLVYEKDEALVYLFDWDAFVKHSYDGEPSEGDAEDLAFQKKTLARLSREFGLTPWRDPEAHLARLQDRWASRIEIDK